MSRARRGAPSPPERPAEPDGASLRQVDRTSRGGATRVDVALASLWILIPGAQYVGSYLRAGVQLDVASGRRADVHLTGIDAMALVDLTPLYALLLAATLVRLAMRWLEQRRTAR